MKKKLFLTVVVAFVFAVILAFAVSAESVHNENTVDYSATVTLNNGTVLPLYDENKNALIWYIDGKDENGNTKYSSAITVKTAKWYTENWNEVTGFGVALEDGTKIDNNNIVVVNMMDDGVVKNSGPGTQYYGQPVTAFKNMVAGRKNLEYYYLRLDTTHINTNTFAGCAKLKYINLENLTQLQRMAQNSQFAGCTSLFDGQVLDLSRTKLYEFEGSSTFSGVPFKGVKFPETMKKIGSGTTFINCTKLEFISIGNKAKFGSSAFEGCTSLKAIYYVGTLEELNASTVGNVVTATTKSYAEYKVLSDKSGVYAVYNYSRCEAFNQGVHGEITATNACVGVCGVCTDNIVSHAGNASTFDTIVYTDYALEGAKTTVCTNEGCTYRATEKAPALFDSLGYSVPEKGAASIVMGFKANKSAIEEYERITAKTVRYGVFVATQNKLGENPIFDANGNVTSGVISAEIAIKSFDLFELKVSGFTDEHKDEKLAMGAYVAITDENITEYSYMQDSTKGEKIGNYFFASFNGITK